MHPINHSELVEKLNKNSKAAKKIKGIKIVRRKNLYEEGNRLTFYQALCILLSVGVGVGYVQLGNFYITNPSFYWYPVVTCIVTLLFSLLSVYLLLDAYKLQNKLGSFQEMAYYFTQDRAAIMIIGFQYGVFCVCMASFCFSNTAFWMIDVIYELTKKQFIMDNYTYMYWATLVVTGWFYYQLSLVQNYQNYQIYAYVICGSMAYTVFMIVFISLYAILIGDWKNNKEYV